MSGEAELFALLKEVSRSFYISVRFLPKRIRLTIALGYLLARASDTIADTNHLPPSERIRVLERLLECITNRQMRGTLDVAACVTAQADGPEKMLSYIGRPTLSDNHTLNQSSTEENRGSQSDEIRYS